MKAVSGIASFYIATVALALRIDASFVGVAGNAMFIDSDELRHMITPWSYPWTIPGFHRSAFLGEGVEDLTTDMPLLEQIGIHPSHCLVGGRQGKFLRLLPFLFLRWLIYLAFFTTKQACHRLGVAQSIEGLYKRDRASTFLGSWSYHSLPRTVML